MKKRILTQVAFLLFFATSAWSLALNDVGEVDHVYSKNGEYAFIKDLNSGFLSELNWVQHLLGDSFMIVAEHEDFQQNEDTYQDWYSVDNFWAYPLEKAPEYFFIKTGNIGGGQTGSQWHFLFENRVSLDWAVIDLGELTDLINGSEGTSFSIFGITKISHLDEVNGSAPVPEPATLLLVGSGLAALAAAKRRRK